MTPQMQSVGCTSNQNFLKPGLVTSPFPRQPPQQPEAWPHTCHTSRPLLLLFAHTASLEIGSGGGSQPPVPYNRQMGADPQTKKENV